MVYIRTMYVYALCLCVNVLCSYPSVFVTMRRVKCFLGSIYITRFLLLLPTDFAKLSFFFLMKIVKN